MNMETFPRDKIFTMRDKTSEVNCSKYHRHFRKVEQKYFILFIIMIRLHIPSQFYIILLKRLVFQVTILWSH